MLNCLPERSRGMDLLAATTLGELLQAIKSDLALKTRVRNPEKLLDRALLWLHDMEVLRLNRGLVVFRPAMTIRLRKGNRKSFTKADFQPLTLHYARQVLQIHVMEEFAERGLQKMGEALRLVTDYFSTNEKAFLERWLPGRNEEIRRQTSPESWQAIVGNLNNSVQQNIVSDDREHVNALVLAGPGSGKTRVLVHRIAYLIRVRRENARSIIALAYNRHAAVDIRRRLVELIGDDSFGVTVLTCHALAMRLAGYSFRGESERPDDEIFKDVMRTAVEVLRGEGLLPEEADERRQRLLRGFQWILVDEYQDIGPEQYELICALAGRSQEEDMGKLSLFAVGDDDQNIYSFRGASVEYIRRFEQDYKAQPNWLIENYRSTRNIIESVNAIIENARKRMKHKHPIQVNRAREKMPAGGQWEMLDPVSRGRVQILPAGDDEIAQAQAVITEFLRLQELDQDWNWARCAVIAREWKGLNPVRALCESRGIPVQMVHEELPRFLRLRETQTLLKWLREKVPGIVDRKALNEWLESCPSDYWYDLIRQSIDEFLEEIGDNETTVESFIEWLAEWGQEIRRRQRRLLLLTAHRAKGLEFDHVAVLDGGWSRTNYNGDPDAERRLYYVVMTRARQTLMLSSINNSQGFQSELRGHKAAIQRETANLSPHSTEVERQFVQPNLQNIDIGFAGRHHCRNPIHKEISRLTAGDPLKVNTEKNGSWLLLSSSGRPVGRLAKSFKPPSGMRCCAAELFAVVSWNRKISDNKFHSYLKCDEWEVVVPTLVFEPEKNQE